MKLQFIRLCIDLVSLRCVVGVKIEIGKEQDFNKDVLLLAVEKGRLTHNFANLFSLGDEENAQCAKN